MREPVSGEMYRCGRVAGRIEWLAVVAIAKVKWYTRVGPTVTPLFLALLLLLASHRRYRSPAHVHSAVRILRLPLLGWFEDLKGYLDMPLRPQLQTQKHTWNEHSSVSSTLIIAPALSNSPQ